MCDDSSSFRIVSHSLISEELSQSVRNLHVGILMLHNVSSSNLFCLKDIASFK